MKRTVTVLASAIALTCALIAAERGSSNANSHFSLRTQPALATSVGSPPAPSTAISTQPPSSALEEQIRELEAQLFTASTRPPVITPELKQRLSALYTQRPENQPRAVTQSADSCGVNSMRVIRGTPYTDSGTTAGYHDDYTPSCGPSGPDVIYLMTAYYTGPHTISLCGSSYDTILHIRDGYGGCPGATEIACNDDACGLQSSLTVNLVAFHSYFIIVDGAAGAAGAYTLSVTDNCVLPVYPEDIAECPETPSPTFGATDCDGGCNNTYWNNPPQFLDIVPGQTYRGIVFTYRDSTTNGYRDTDWYRFTLAEPCSVRVHAEGEFGLESYFFAPGCTAGPITWNSVPACSLFTLAPPNALAAGTYYLVFAPATFDALPPRPYRFWLDVHPSTSCTANFILTAPGETNFFATTCFADNSCSLRPSRDNLAQITIPYESDWFFSMCASFYGWNSYIYLTTHCCYPGTVIASNDDGCGPLGPASLTAHLTAGTYYLIIEGSNDSDCGIYTLAVTEVQGRCCYGGTTPSCTITSGSNCAALGGIFSPGLTCDSTCLVRPECLMNSDFSQRPALPGELWDGSLSDQDGGHYNFEDFSGMVEPIGSIRFWGFRVAPGDTACSEDPMPFHIRFFQTISGNVGATAGSADITVSGTPGYSYIGQDTMPIMQYSAQIDPPVNLSAGWVSVVGDGDAGCRFYWATAHNGNSVSRGGNSPDGTNSNLSIADFSLCLGPTCRTADSLVVRYEPSGPYNQLDFYCSQPGLYRIYATTDHNAIYPAAFTEQAFVYVDPGHWTWQDSNLADLYKRYLIVQDCGSEAPPVADIGHFHIANAAR